MIQIIRKGLRLLSNKIKELKESDKHFLEYLAAKGKEIDETSIPDNRYELKDKKDESNQSLEELRKVSNMLSQILAISGDPNSGDSDDD